MREKAFTKIGLKSSSASIWKLQREAHTMQKVECSSPVKQEELESAREHLKHHGRLLGSVNDCLQRLIAQTRSLLKEQPDHTKSEGKLTLYDLETEEVDPRQGFERLKTSIDNRQRELSILIDRLSPISQIPSKPYSDPSEISRLSRQVAELENRLAEVAEEYEMKLKYEIIKQSEGGSIHLEELERTSKERDFYKHQEELLRQEIFAYKEQIDRLNDQHQRELETMTSKVKEGFENSYHQELQSMRHRHEQRESELQARLEHLSSYEQRDLREAIPNEHKWLLSAIYDHVYAIYQEYFNAQTEWMEELWQRKRELINQYGLEELVEVLLMIDFLAHMLRKVTIDNNWLVERLAGQEQPRNQDGLYKKVWNDIQSTSDALKDFEEARDKLVEQFRKSSRRS